MGELSLIIFVKKMAENTIKTSDTNRIQIELPMGCDEKSSIGPEIKKTAKHRHAHSVNIGRRIELKLKFFLPMPIAILLLL